MILFLLLLISSSVAFSSEIRINIEKSKNTTAASGDFYSENGELILSYKDTKRTSTKLSVPYNQYYTLYDYTKKHYNQRQYKQPCIINISHQENSTTTKVTLDKESIANLARYFRVFSTQLNSNISFVVTSNQTIEKISPCILNIYDNSVEIYCPSDTRRPIIYRLDEESKQLLKEEVRSNKECNVICIINNQKKYLFTANESDRQKIFNLAIEQPGFFNFKLINPSVVMAFFSGVLLTFLYSCHKGHISIFIG